MFFYQGLACPHCNQAFDERDDIVACPVCGAPHHRDCWKEHGGCACAADHGTQRQWSRETAAPEEPADTPTAENDAVLVVNKHNFSREMPALPLVYLEAQIAERERAYRGQGSGGCFFCTAQHPDFGRIERAQAGERLADANIGAMERILFAEVVCPGVFGLQAQAAFQAHGYLVEQRQKTAVIDIGLGDKRVLFHIVKARQKLAQQDEHFLLIAGVAGIDKQAFPTAFDDGGIAAAGRFDE